MHSNKPSIFIWDNADTLATAAAHFFVAACRDSIRKRKKFVVALSGGNTPAALYRLLASPAFSRNIDWNRVFLFWSDERFVAHEDPDSNYRMVKENLLDHVAIPPENIFGVPVEGAAKKCAHEYQLSIEKFFGKRKPVFDWLLLGLGEDGHTASLFPGTAILKEKKKWVSEVWVEAKETWRISFTFRLINEAAAIIFLVSGSAKAGILGEVLSPSSKSKLPARLVMPDKGTVTWMLDMAAVPEIKP